MMSKGIRFLLASAGWLALATSGCGTSAEEEVTDRARSSLQTLSGCFSVRYHFVENGGNDFFVEDNIEYMDITEQGEEVLARNFLVLDDEDAFLHWTQEWKPMETGHWQIRVNDGTGVRRYETTGVWRFNQWEGEPALATKPTRDSARTDYDVLERRNIIQFVSWGWIQSEVNMKLRDDGTAVASELGWIVYTRLSTDAPCVPAMEMAAGSR